MTVLGLYYKWQAFFFIPLGAMQTCIVPVISYNYAGHNIGRCRETLKTALIFGLSFMALGVVCFETVPGPLLQVFSSDERVIDIGRRAFRIIGLSFIPLVPSLLPSVLPGGWRGGKELPPHRGADRGVLCPAGIAFRPARP